jgi:L-ascorbate metabolism protein UlaG (beta-lactamase superfamily)
MYSEKMVTHLTITIRCLAHASFQIRTEDKVIYIDPSTKYTNLKEKDFEPADLILVTHGHEDHCDPKLLKKIRKLGSPILAPTSCKKTIGKAGVVWDIDPGQFMEISGGVKVTAIDAYNVKRFRPSGEPFHPKGVGAGFIITLEGKKIYHAGDTDLIPVMEDLYNIDVALLPAGDTYTMDINEAAEAAIMINPTIAIPMHLKGADPEVFKSTVESKSSTKVVILNEGDEYTLE